jgi:hypothetical protein
VSSGQSSWLQIHRSRFNSWHYQIFWEVDLERGPLSLVSTIEELLRRKSSGFGLESWEYGRRDSSRWPRDTLCPKKLVLTSPTSAVSQLVLFSDSGHGVFSLGLCGGERRVLMLCLGMCGFIFLCSRWCVMFGYNSCLNFSIGKHWVFRMLPDSVYCAFC